MNVTEIRVLFVYNEWANVRLLDAVGQLSDEQFTRPLASSFPSIRDTFSHVIAVEWVWLRRWKGESPALIPEWAVGSPLELLRKKLKGIEAERATFLTALGEQEMQQPVSYTNFKGERWRYALEDLLLHLVNHSTYHRGQVATMLRQVGALPPATDFLVYKDELRMKKD
ncbi:MAG: DinB family protein [Acidobacteriota bacterium]